MFTNNPDLVDWQNGDFKLQLFLDGLDEAIVQIKSATRQIYKHIANNKAHLDRLYLRITCRIADWPEEFEDELKQAWPSQTHPVY